MSRTGFLFFAACLFVMPAAVAAKAQDFGAWLDGVRAEARQRGISEKTVNAALPPTLRPLERVIALDRKQPEKTRTFTQYRQDMVNARRVQDGRTMFYRHRDTLNIIGREYGVDPQFIAALWGIETNYGRNTGGHDVITALATLAWDGRRGEYFRGELFKALQIVDEGHVALPDMKGSWAGAMGQTQFMPSSFYNFAQDYDRDGRRDIWTAHKDVFASAANYLARSGWKYGEPWGRRVTVPAHFSKNLAGLDVQRDLKFWHNNGVRLPDGSPIPLEGATLYGSIVQPDGPGGESYLVHDNYRVILKWNRSTYFATAVGLLADSLRN